MSAACSSLCSPPLPATATTHVSPNHAMVTSAHPDVEETTAAATSVRRRRWRNNRARHTHTSGQKNSNMTTLSATLVTLMLAVVARGSDECMLAFFTTGDVVKLRLSESSNSTIESRVPMPLSHSFSWSFALGGDVAFLMGGAGTSSRTAYAINASTGAYIANPSVGYVFDTYYNGAATSDGALFGTWQLKNDWFLARINITSGRPAHRISPCVDTSVCFQPSCGLSTSCGWIDRRGIYSVPVACHGDLDNQVLLQFDTARETCSKVVSPNISFDTFVVHRETGRRFTTAYHTGNSVFEVLDDGSVLTVAQFPSFQLLAGSPIVQTHTSVCVLRDLDSRYGRSHPEAADLWCMRVVDEHKNALPPGRFGASSYFQAPDLFMDGRVLYLTKALGVEC